MNGKSTLISKSVSVAGITLNYGVAGTGQPILFVHGFPLAGEMWKQTASALASRWRCIVPDLRGHGKSSATPQVSMADFAFDLVLILDHLRERRPVTLVGLSMGGYIAFEFFRQCRDRLRALVLADTRAAADDAEAAARREETAKNVLKNGSKVVADAMIDKLFAPGAPAPLRDRWHGVMSGTSPAGVAAAARAMAARADSVPTLSKINCPTLIVCGESDTLTPPDLSREMQRAIPKSRLELIAKAGHLPPVEQPDAFTRVLRTFLEQLT